MEASYRFFENKECKYFPCHEGLEEFNCLFCYCPMYHKENCPGNPRYIEKGDRKIKVCTDCTFPHRPDNYDKVIEILKNGD
ncbi:MAG: metal-binding protein [Lachnospiraceae bacterium]|nr:metal-binding protein [Lachnospiraceae bacterium]